MQVACEENNIATFADAMKGTDVFLGLSIRDCVKPEWLVGMNDSPLIMALANPVPEIDPELVLKTRKDAIMCTGRSD